MTSVEKIRKFRKTYMLEFLSKYLSAAGHFPSDVWGFADMQQSYFCNCGVRGK